MAAREVQAATAATLVPVALQAELAPRRASWAMAAMAALQAAEPVVGMAETGPTAAPSHPPSAVPGPMAGTGGTPVLRVRAGLVSPPVGMEPSATAAMVATAAEPEILAIPAGSPGRVAMAAMAAV